MPTRPTIRTLAALLLFGFASASTAIETVRRGTLVLGDAACEDTEPEVATQADGTLLVVWQRCLPSRVAAQRFDPIGRRLGTPIDLGDGFLPQVAALPDRGFAIAYLRQPVPGIESYGVYVRRLGPAGVPLGEAVRVDPPGEASPVAYAVPRIAAAPEGRLFVAWRDVFLTPIPSPVIDLPALGRMLKADLAPLGDLFEIGPAGFLDDLEVSFDEAGHALAVTALGSVAAQRFDPSGATGTKTEVGGGSLPVYNPRLAPRPGGGWWIVWEEAGTALGTSRVLLRALGADGRTAGPRIDLGLLGALETTWPAVSVDPDGLVLVAARDRFGAIQHRVFDSTGAPISELTPLAAPDPFAVGRPALSERSATGFAAVWAGGARPGPLPGTFTGWDLGGALLAAAICPDPHAVCARAGSDYAKVVVRWKLGALSGFGRGVRVGQRLLFTLEHPERFDVVVNLRGGAIDWAAATSAEVEISWLEGGITNVATKPRGPFASGRLNRVPPASTTAEASDAPPAIQANFAESSEALPAAGAVACVPSTTTTCLLDGRFRVAAANVPVAGAPHRPAEVLAFSDRQTLLSFPGGDGALLTLIDGRAINGKIWVHWGGLSDTAFQIVVTDTTTGIARSYTNPAGKRQSQADRLAF